MSPVKDCPEIEHTVIDPSTENRELVRKLSSARVTFLSQVLPAVRQVRAPLVGGYLWLLAGWLRWSESVPESSTADQNRYWHALARLVDEVGSVGAFAAVSVAAYLIGSLVSEGIGFAIRHFGELDTDEMEQAREIWEAKYAAEVPIRLLAEAELRFNVALPLLIVTVVLPPTAWTLALLALVLALTTHGIWLLRTARLKWRIASRISRIDLDGGETGDGSARADEEGVESSLDAQPSLNDALDKLRELGPNAKLSAEAISQSDMMPAEGIRLTNPGPGSARRVSLLDGDNQDLPYFPRGTFPIDELPAGTDIRLPFKGDSTPTTTNLEFWLTWEDKHGSQRKLQKVRVGGFF